ncbi:uncharacterized protein CFP56_026312 [Quercus suber]|uniref:Zinc knuckle CX2CX4HX4C domain-containing protein n=1 Tax=Quercus suber TaxID=58331 RepID=A0AAW0K1A9_QUESU
MDDLTSRCEKLSLSVREGRRVKLSNHQRASEHVLAAKFLTRRALNMEAVARTFRPLWRTKESFQITNAGNNILLFAFDLEVDVEKVLIGEPWSFDRHLVVFQRFDGSKPLKELDFKSSSFWVQLYDLPYQFLTPEAAVEIGETIGPVTVSRDTNEMKGGTFMRVRVSVDISRPLCRGRKVSFDEETESWVSFKYERLPNICFWCGMLSHDDKDCDLWLGSKGTLPTESQQFGHWIRASQFSPGRRQTIEVKGFGEGMYQPSSYKGTALPTQRQRKEVVPSRPLLQEGGQDVDGGSSQSPVMLPESDGQARLEENTGSPRFAAISVPKISGADFEEILKDIDSEILEDHHDHLPVVTEIIQQLNKSAGHSNSVKQNTESQVVLGEGISKIIDKGEMGTGQTRERFQMGWVEEKDNNKGKKTAGKKMFQETLMK